MRAGQARAQPARGGEGGGEARAGGGALTLLHLHCLPQASPRGGDLPRLRATAARGGEADRQCC